MEIKKIESDELKGVEVISTSSSIKVESYTGKRGEKGEQGEKGEPFRYSDFTPEQLNALKGKDGVNGKDGYTPIKGVDYFDGKDGYTPVKGIDYFDGKNGANGKDGYTPIKGIDYFDGKDGKDGVVTDSQISQIVETIKNKISVPTKTSQLTNDSNFLTSHQDISGKQDKITSSNKLDYSLISGAPTIPDISNLQTKITTSNKLDYSLIDNTPIIPTVPTNVSSFTNDAGYLTQHQDISGKQDKITSTNKLAYSLLSGTPTIPTTLPASDVSLSNGTITIKGSTIKPLTSIPSEYVTETELNQKGYLTSIPDTYATKQYVTDTIGVIENGTY